MRYVPRSRVPVTGCCRGGFPSPPAATCRVCEGLPGTTCLEGDQELTQVHSSRRMSIAERLAVRARLGVAGTGSAAPPATS